MDLRFFLLKTHSGSLKSPSPNIMSRYERDRILGGRAMRTSVRTCAYQDHPKTLVHADHPDSDIGVHCAQDPPHSASTHLGRPRPACARASELCSSLLGATSAHVAERPARGPRRFTGEASNWRGFLPVQTPLPLYLHS